MNTSQQDAILRLEERSHDFTKYVEHLRERREVYVTALTTADLKSVEKLQGTIQAFDEVLRIPVEAASTKTQRTI